MDLRSAASGFGLVFQTTFSVSFFSRSTEGAIGYMRYETIESMALNNPLKVWHCFRLHG